MKVPVGEVAGAAGSCAAVGAGAGVVCPSTGASLAEALWALPEVSGVLLRVSEPEFDEDGSAAMMPFGEGLGELFAEGAAEEGTVAAATGAPERRPMV